MATYGVIEDVEKVDYSTKCCCKTTDGKFYEVPKDYFRLNANVARRKLVLAEPFEIPIDSKTFDQLLVLLEKAALLTAAALEEAKAHESARPEWMRSLGKRELKFVAGCLGIESWEGKSVQFYPEPLPKIGEVVWAKVVGVNETSAVVQLMEYAGREGIIPYTEVTRRRVRSMGKFIKVGRSEAAQVIRIDADKGYIDLSKKQVVPTEARACEAKFRKGNEVRSIVCHVAEECGFPAQEAMEKIAFPLYTREPGKHAWTWLYELNQTQDKEGILGPLNLDEKVIESLMGTLKNAMRAKIFTLQADVDITCFDCDGVDAIREVLIIGKNFGEGKTPYIPLAVSIVGPPKYSIRARTDMKEEGIQLMKDAIDTMKIAIAQRGGNLKVVVAPQALGDDEKPDRIEDQEDEEDD